MSSSGTVMIFIVVLCSMLLASTNAAKKVCYEHLGCFSMQEPWLSNIRPVPAPGRPQDMMIRAFYYSRTKPNKRYIIQTWPRIDLQGAPFDGKKETIFITHGYETLGSDDWLMEMKDAFLSRLDANVLIGDWGKGAKGVNYFIAVGNTRMAARQFSNLLQFLIDQRGLEVSRLHILGHSLGAQICAYIGKSIPGIFKITGMDAAQPLFEGSGPKVHLTRNDAKYVIAVHADARPFIPDIGFGYMNEVGDIDFYMNGGHGQPGCSFPQVVNIPNITSLSDFITVPNEILQETLLCPHGLSHVFVTESIKNTHCIFWGHNATMKNMLLGITNSATQGFFSKYLGISEDCTFETCSPMTLSAHEWPARGAFVVGTRGSSPYCIYESGIIPDASQKHFLYNIQKAGMTFLRKDNKIV